MANSNDNIIHTLLSYKELSKYSKNHADLLKDKTIILYTATLLEMRNCEILNLCLDILSNLIDNEKTHSTLLSMFGIFEALESLTIRSFSSIISERAAILTDTLRKTASPAYSTRSRTTGSDILRNPAIFHLYIAELTHLNRTFLDETLVSIKGIISFVVDLEQQRCTIRIGKVRLQTVISHLLIRGFKALVIERNVTTGVEKFMDILQDGNKTFPLDYFPDFESPPKGPYNLNTFRNNIHRTAGGFLKSAAKLWNNSFYW